MATMQVRGVPDDVYRIYRVRAASAGMSLQEYLLGELVRNAHLRTPTEVVAEVDRRMRTEGLEGLSHSSCADVIRGDRQGH